MNCDMYSENLSVSLISDNKENTSKLKMDYLIKIKKETRICSNSEEFYHFLA